MEPPTAGGPGLGASGPHCCQHQLQPWIPALQPLLLALPTCRMCLRPVLPPAFLQPQPPPCLGRLSRLDWHLIRQQQQQQQPQLPQLPWLAQPLPADGRSCFSLSRSPPAQRRRHRSPGSGSLGRRSPGARASSLLPPRPQRWIGEETRQALPCHVYKYYLAQTREYRRQHAQVPAHTHARRPRGSGKLSRRSADESEGEQIKSGQGPSSASRMRSDVSRVREPLWL